MIGPYNLTVLKLSQIGMSVFVSVQTKYKPEYGHFSNYSHAPCTGYKVRPTKTQMGNLDYKKKLVIAVYKNVA